MPKVVELAIRRCVNGGETIKSVAEDINDQLQKSHKKGTDFTRFLQGHSPIYFRFS